MLFNKKTAPLSENDKGLVALLFDEYHRLMLHVATTVLGDPAPAEDVVSESLLKIIQHRDKLRDVTSHRTKSYIVHIVRTTALNHIKQNALRAHEPEEMLDDVADGNIHIPDGLVAKEGIGVIMEAFQALPALLKEVAYLYLVHGYSHGEIAKALNISEATSKKRLSRARMAVKETLGGDKGDK